MRTHISVARVDDDHFVQRIIHVAVRAEAGALAWIALRLLFEKFQVGSGKGDDGALGVKNFVGLFFDLHDIDHTGAFRILRRMRPAAPERNIRMASLISSSANSCVNKPSSRIRP